MRKTLFACFFLLCCVVMIMVAQTLYLQSEALSESKANAGISSSRSGFVDTLKYYIFLPRTKIQLFIRHLRRKFKKQSYQDGYVQPDLKNVISGLVTQREYIKYLVFVISAPSKRSTRDLIRTKGYWAHNWTDSDTGLPVDWKAFFVVGQNEDQAVNDAVREEAAEHPDLLVGGFDDSYKNLVFKTLWLIEWAANTYDFDVMVKCDDDTIIHLTKLDLLMKQQDLSVPFYGGVRFGGMPVFRNGRYQVTKEEWEPDRFPPYCSGGGYSLNKLAIMKLLEVHYSGVQPLFLVEDAFIGVLAYHAKIDPVDLVPSFRPWFPHKFCDKEVTTLLHYVTDKYMVEYMEYFRRIGLFCDEQFVIDHKDIIK